MERRDLEGMSREDLVTRARRAGVGRAELLTRVELVDEIVKRIVTEPEKRTRARGLLGRARDLLATVIERGLHLPDAAARVRSFPTPTLPPVPEPVATVTLAEIYAAQGHTARALRVLDEVLAAEPEHEAALALRLRFAEKPVAEAGASVEPTQTLGASEAHASVNEPRVSPAAAAKPIPMLDDAPLPDGYGVDEAVVMPVDPTTAYVYWEVRPATVARARAHAATGRLIVRVEAEAGTQVTVREIEAERRAGDYFLFGLPPGARLSASLSWATSVSVEPLAKSSSPVATPRRTATGELAETVVTWSARPALAPVPTSSPDGVAIAIAIARALSGDAPVSRPRAPEAPLAPTSPLGSSELRVAAPGAPIGSSDLSAGS